MKKILALLYAAALMTVACEREEPTPEVDNPNQTYPFSAEVISNAVIDYDGNSYDAVRIGEQVWMASNLRTTHYANGEEIPEGTVASDTVPFRYNPDNNEANVAAYGYLYNWPAVMHGAASSEANPSEVQGICPNGWHVPSDAEWTQLRNFCARTPECVCSGSGSKIAKSLAADHDWAISTEECAVGNDLSSNNITGFSALPAGSYHGRPQDDYVYFGLATLFWSATERNSSNAFSLDLYYDEYYVGNWIHSKSFGLSVRCVRD